MKNTSKLFVTGMFRSGTTLLARMFGIHPEMAFASDPFARVWKAFRNDVLFQNGYEMEGLWNMPLDDYYFYSEKLRTMESLKQANLDLSIKYTSVDAIREDVARATQLFSPRLIPRLDELRGETYRDVFLSGLQLVQSVYGSGDVSVQGFKEVWAGEFADTFLSAFPEARVIHLIRDPRAVCASKNVNEEKYPWLFLVRQWRKLAACAWQQQATSPHRDRIMVLRYEDLISDPEHHVENMCRFAGIDFHEALLQPEKFRDGEGNQWKQNSSHYSGKTGFNTASLERWKEVLEPNEQRYIEWMCEPEMKLFKYQAAALSDEDREQGVAAPLLPQSQVAQWLKPYWGLEGDRAMDDTAWELRRRQLIGEARGGKTVEAELKQRVALFEEVFDAVV